jgi:hypothetical protein
VNRQTIEFILKIKELVSYFYALDTIINSFPYQVVGSWKITSYSSAISSAFIPRSLVGNSLEAKSVASRANPISGEGERDEKEEN